ncbi:ABC transporter permease [Ancylobacter sp. MQZ15Z-1]|uniref:ABC transporter permease n=1 Tax=Ancylobacter mangrovi TaxID=2972472 RepID=A0A9X2T2F7_9HYPH|nr:ABC transporter permease [Ancylobacter mangrovi]MCS0493761.1 ABC transporter permease [Ancylobacter mangrovi]
MAASRTALALLLFAPLAFFAAFFLAPMAVVAISSVTTDGDTLTFAHYARILLDEYHWDVLWVTFRIALMTTLICMLVGFPLAWYLVRIVRWRTWRRICVILVIVPLFTSNIVRSFGWMVLLGRTGLVNQALMTLGLTERPIRFLGTETGILIGLVYILVPFVVLAVGNALATIDNSYEEASADLGVGPARTFWFVTLPLCLPGAVSGAIIVFALAVSAYVTPALLSGGQITVFSMLIFQQYSSVFDFHYGAALSITLLVLTLVLVGIAGRIGDAGRRAA